MKHLAEYRDAETARRLAAEIDRTVTRPWAIMEVCGGQTHSIIRNGIDQLLPSGPDRRARAPCRATPARPTRGPRR